MKIYYSRIKEYNPMLKKVIIKTSMLDEYHFNRANKQRELNKGSK